MWRCHQSSSLALRNGWFQLQSAWFRVAKKPKARAIHPGIASFTDGPLKGVASVSKFSGEPLSFKFGKQFGNYSTTSLWIWRGHEKTFHSLRAQKKRIWFRRWLYALIIGLIHIPERQRLSRRVSCRSRCHKICWSITWMKRGVSRIFRISCWISIWANYYR